MGLAKAAKTAVLHCRALALGVNRSLHDFIGTSTYCTQRQGITLRIPHAKYIYKKQEYRLGCPAETATFVEHWTAYYRWYAIGSGRVEAWKNY